VKGFDGGELARQKGNSEDRRKQTYGFYIEQLFKRKGMASLVLSKEKIHRLAFVAGCPSSFKCLAGQQSIAI
jgi:hypothetical protein